MIVPQYWAEGRCRHSEPGRQVTVLRFGWSDLSQDEAQSHADARARESLARILAGEKLSRRELKVAYNGADGAPIREEILSRHGETVITRNIYGARCLNTPDVLFVDIDFQEEPGLLFTFSVFAVLLFIAIAIGLATHLPLLGVAFFIVALFVGIDLSVGLYRFILLRIGGGPERIAHKRISNFIARHPDWHLRLYRTPAGLRVLAMHRTFNPEEDAVAECFRSLSADPVYVQMCLNQKCFRARISPKPWRVGIREHIKPRPGVWPVKPERLAQRQEWIDVYEQAALGYASCRFIESVGSNIEHPSAKAVQMLHDEICKATCELPIA